MAEPTTLAHSLQNTINGQTVALAKLSDVVGDLAINLTISVLILAVAVWLSGWAGKLVRNGIGRIPRVNQDRTLSDFASSFVRYVVVVIGIIAVLRRLGVETTSIIAVLGAASLAVGLALQGTLSNVAAGVMVLIFRPYRIGDLVTIAGKTGTVQRFDLFNTEIRDPDNLKIVIPNGKAFGDVVTNYTDIKRRRIELVFGIGYDDDLGKAINLAIAAATADARVLPDPAPWCKATELAASAVNVTLRCWTAPTGFLDTRYDLLRKVKEAFDANGISFPYPTQATVERVVADDAGSARATPAHRSAPN